MYQGDNLVKQVKDVNSALDGVIYGLNRITKSHTRYGGTTKASYGLLQSYTSAQKLPIVNKYIKEADSTFERMDYSHHKPQTVNDYESSQRGSHAKSHHRIQGMFI
jgi:hypothetical protein